MLFLNDFVWYPEDTYVELFGAYTLVRVDFFWVSNLSLQTKVQDLNWLSEYDNRLVLPFVLYVLESTFADLKYVVLTELLIL
jgi:hypothetical protein